MGLTSFLPLIALAVIILFLFYILPRRKKSRPSENVSRGLYHAETALLACSVAFFAALSIEKAAPLFVPPAHHAWMRIVYPWLNGLFWGSLLACAVVHLVLKQKNHKGGNQA